MTDDRRRAEDKALIKEAIKEAVKEWLQEVYASFGKWSIRGIGAALIVALLYFILTMNGWSHAPSISHAVDMAK